jgi:hypothetical protein
VRRIKLLLRVFAGAVAFLLYVWFAAVRSLGQVKRDKARRRARRRAAARPSEPIAYSGDTPP